MSKEGDKGARQFNSFKWLSTFGNSVHANGSKNVRKVNKKATRSSFSSKFKNKIRTFQSRRKKITKDDIIFN